MVHMRKCVFAALFPLVACGPQEPDPAADRCREQGFRPGTALFQECVENERATRMLKEEREQLEQLKREREFWDQVRPLQR